MSKPWRSSRVAIFGIISLLQLLRFVCRVSIFEVRPPVVVSSLLLLTNAFASFGADQLQEIRQRGVLLWGADAEGGAPYVYPDPEKPERMIGFEYELAEALGAKLGVKA